MITDAREREARLFLAAAGLFATPRQNALLAAAGNALALLEGRAPEGTLAPEELEALRRAAEGLRREGLAERLAAEGVSLLLRGDPGYPPQLLHAQEPPQLLFVKGRLPEAPAVAVVGTRRPGVYGRQQAIRFAAGLASAGLAVASGLADGVDSAALAAAASAGGPVLGVIGTGIRRVYPAGGAKLHALVAERGAVVSEFPPDAAPLPHHFPWRNRLIAAWSLGTLVVEAAVKSGSLITVRQAREMGRHVFAVPGPADAESSRGCHRVIREGGLLVEDPADILAVLEAATPPTAAPAADEAPDALGLSSRPRSLEDLCAASGLEPAALQAALVKAMVQGRARRVDGGRWVRDGGR